MKCRQCNSISTKVVVTEHKGNETWRYCKCLDCNSKYKTIEVYAIPKRGSIPGVKQHSNCLRRGQDNGSSVLTEANVLEIRRLAANGYIYDSIAKVFGISKSTVYRIVKRKLWSHV